MPNTMTGRARSVIEAARGLEAMARRGAQAQGQPAVGAGDGSNLGRAGGPQGGQGQERGSMNFG